MAFVVKISLENPSEVGQFSTAGKQHCFFLLAGNVATGETFIKARYIHSIRFGSSS